MQHQPSKHQQQTIQGRIRTQLKFLLNDQAGKGGLGSLLSVLFLVAVASLALTYHQDIVDRWRLHNYNPPTEVASIATQDTMTGYARKVFYVNSPSISEKTDFRTQCPNNGGEQTIVLGCYKSGQNGIFLLDVTDTRLDGVEQVTAAHETLHAAYDRLSSKERKRVNGLLMDYYNNDLKDERIKSTIDAYKKSEPNDVVNEMHSIFGTEVATLPASLEQYYAKYFTDRTKVAAFAAKYQAEFNSRQTAVAADDAKLASLKTQITSNEADLKIQQQAMQTQQAQLTSLRNSGDTAAYNAAVPVYNRAIENYNSLVTTTKSLIAQYNQLVAERNAIAVEEGELAGELNANTPQSMPQ